MKKISSNLSVEVVEKYKSEYSELFGNEEFISREKFVNVARKVLGLSKKEARQLFDGIDKDKDGKISVEDYVNGIAELEGYQLDSATGLKYKHHCSRCGSEREKKEDKMCDHCGGQVFFYRNEKSQLKFVFTII